MLAHPFTLAEEGQYLLFAEVEPGGQRFERGSELGRAAPAAPLDVLADLIRTGRESQFTQTAVQCLPVDHLALSPLCADRALLIRRVGRLGSSRTVVFPYEPGELVVHRRRKSNRGHQPDCGSSRGQWCQRPVALGRAQATSLTGLT